MLATRRATPVKWTVQQFHTLCSTGILKWRRLFLLRGVIHDQGKMSPPHAVGIELASEILRATLPTGVHVRPQMPLVLSPDTDPVPDIAVVAGTIRDFMTLHPTMSPLVVEVSDTTFDTDVIDKAGLYATAGVPDYWVFDIESRQLLVYRDPTPADSGSAAYSILQKFNTADFVTPLHFPTVSIKVADLLP